MPWLFAVSGVVFILAGIRGKSGELVTLLEEEFTGKPNFIWWVLAILSIGALGYVDALRVFSRALLGLVLLVLILAEDKQGSGGFFVEFENAIKQISGSS
jgi:hypothetical protein